MWYYIWGGCTFIIFCLKDVIEYLYLKYNTPVIIRKRDFNDLSYFEKLFLVLFHRPNWFSKSIANLYSNRNLFNYRKDKYPLIFFFHLYYDKGDYNFSNLKNLLKQYKYFSSSKVFNRKIKIVKHMFFKKLSINRKNNFIQFVILQKILYKRYYNLCASVYFKKHTYLNTLKLNWLFYIFLLRSKKKYVVFDLSKYSDFYEYNFNKKIVSKPFKLNKIKSTLYYDFKKKKNEYLYKIYNKYNKIYKKLYIHSIYSYKNIILMKIQTIIPSKININSKKLWLTFFKKYYPIRFSESSISKHIKLDSIKKYTFFYLRKNRIFNKSRYSRNRQLYRTGVYWCLWLNVVVVYGLYFIFYRFTFNFGYIWWGLLIFVYSFIFSRVVKYNFYNIYYLYEESVNFCKWVGFLSNEIHCILYKMYEQFTLNLTLINFTVKYSNYKYSAINTNTSLIVLRSFLKWINILNSKKFIYLWETMKEKDNSLLRYKSVIHWFTQVYKLLTY